MFTFISNKFYFVGCPVGYKIFPQLHQAFHYNVKNICQGGVRLPGRFVWANGNPDGRGLHADFLNGWDPVTMNAAINQCLGKVPGQSCPANGNGCPAGLLGCVLPASTPYTRKESTYDYTGVVATGIPPSVYTLDQGIKPSWGWTVFAPIVSGTGSVVAVSTSPTADSNTIIGVIVLIVCLRSLLAGIYFYYCGCKRVNVPTAGKSDEFMFNDVYVAAKQSDKFATENPI